MTQHLGRRPHDPKRPVLRLAHYLTSGTSYPVFADYLGQVEQWDAYASATFATGGPAAVGNQRRQVTTYLTDTVHAPAIDDVFGLYRASGNPAFDPETGAGDGGVVLADMLDALLRDGIGGVHPLAYLAVDHTNPDELRTAISLFGSVILGVDLDVAQDDQSEAGLPWDYVRRSQHWGGHTVLAGAYTSDVEPGHIDMSVISWGERIGTTDAFAARQLQEAWVVIWPENLGTQEFADGVDMARLAADYEQLTGRAFPALPGEEPTPEPEVIVDPTPTEAIPVVTAEAPAVPAEVEFKAALAVFIRAAQRWLDEEST